MKKETSLSKKVMIGVGAVALGTGLALGGAVLGDNTEQKALDLANEKIAELESVEPEVVTETVTVTEETIVEVPVEVIVTETVKVDNENLPMVMEYIIDQDGDLTELDVSEIDDEGVDELVSQIAFISEVKDMAVQEVKDELADELDGEKVPIAGEPKMTLDEDDIERLRIDDDYDELIVEDIDFDDGDAEVTVTGTFEQDDVKFDFTAIVDIKDGEVDEIDNISVSERV